MRQNTRPQGDKARLANTNNTLESGTVIYCRITLMDFYITEKYRYVLLNAFTLSSDITASSAFL